MEPEIEPIETRVISTPQANWIALPVLLFMLAVSFGAGVALAIVLHQ